MDTEKSRKIYLKIGGTALAVGMAVVTVLAGTQGKNSNGQNNA